jgi:hypothetical protein
MSNIADAMNQAGPVVDALTERLAGQKSEKVQAAFKLKATKELIPQIHWDKFEALLKEAEKEGLRDEVVTAVQPGTAPPAPDRPGEDGGMGGGNDIISPAEGAFDSTTAA